MSRRVLLHVTLLIAATAAPARAQSLATTIADYAKAHSFNGTILVQQGRRKLYQGSFGIADQSFGIPVANDTRFRIASITKAFTSALILQLYDQGKLDLNAPIKTYLPDYAGEGAERVTIHNLLNHTSGIRNMDTVKSYEDAARYGMDAYQLPHTTADLLTRYASGKLVHEVGKVFDYNNADYIILGEIIARVTGRTYDAALRERILGPLGMTSTGVLYQQDIVANLAPTYWKPDSVKPLINDLPVYMQNWYAAGGMYSTTADLAVFSTALFGAKLLKPETLGLMLRAGLDDYGYGVWVDSTEIGGRQRRFVHRPGSIMGANSVLIRYLNEGLTIVILSNTNATDIDKFGFLIGRAVLK